MAKALFLLPLRDNDGRDLATEIADVRTELYARFAAWTFEGYVEGAFKMSDGTQAIDRNAKYMVFLDETRIGELEQVLVDFKRKTVQEKIYLEIQHNVDIRLL
jgi:hypothetical protein